MVISREESGDILVRNAPETSPAGKAGVRIGDFLLAIDARDVHNADIAAVVF